MIKPRKIFQQLLVEKDSKKISILIGPRQVGKTTLLKEIYKTTGGVFLNIDNLSDYEKASSYQNLLNSLKIQGYKENQKGFFYVFMDEFQKYGDLSIVMKNIYDQHDNIKIFASGSSSLLIKNNIQESLAGRKRILYIYPLDFEEFLLFKERSDLVEQIKNLKTIKKVKECSKLLPEVFLYWEEFVIFGGYPEVALCSKDQKKQALANIFDLYLKKDLVDFLDVQALPSAQQLVRQLAINNGCLANYSQYGARTGLDGKLVKNYIKILQETFLIMVLKPYFINKNKEISKAPKIYFLDNGVRNYFYNNFNNLNLRNDTGFLFEGFYLGELIKNGEDLENIKYFRSKNGVEVDLILDRVSEIVPIELKCKDQIKLRDFQGLLNFMNEYKIKESYLVNIGEAGNMTIKDLLIKKILFFENKIK